MNRSTARFALYGLSALLAVAGFFVALILLTSSTSSEASSTSEQQPAAAASQTAASSGTGSKTSSSSSATTANSAQSTPQPSSGGSQGNEAAASEHVHSWATSETMRRIPERSHTETVTVPGEDIIEYHTECDACGAVCDGVDALAEHFQAYPDHAKSGYTTNCPVVTGRTADATETVIVVDEAAHDEVVTTRRCSTCGAEEQSVS